MQISDILHVLDFLIQKEKSKNTFSDSIFDSYYQKLKNTLIDSKNNEFAKNLIIKTFYSVLKDEKLNISEFISDTTFISVLNNYNAFNNSFEEKHDDKIKKIILKFKEIFNIDSIKNQSDIASFVIVESLMEYSASKKRFLPKSNPTDTHIHSNVIHKKFYYAYTDNDILKELQDKEYGFYVFRVPYKEIISSTRNLSDMLIVSHQSNGVTLFNPYSTVLGRYGLTGSSFSLDNIISKEYKIKFETKENKTTELSTEHQESSDFDNLKLVNKLILQSYISLASTKEEIEKNEKEYKAIVFKNTSDENTTNLPIVASFENNDIHSFSFDEMRFSGKYSFMSPLDDIFADFIDMDIVNLKGDTISDYYSLERNLEPNRSSPLKPKDFKPSTIKDCFYVKTTELENFGVGKHRNRNFLIPITESTIGSEEDVLFNSKKLALINKLSLMNLLMNLHYEFYHNVFHEELRVFLNENMETIINDERFLKLITDTGISLSTKPNHYNIDGWFNSVFVSKEKSKLSDYENKENIKDYTSSRKAINLIGIALYDVRMIDLFVNEYGLELSTHSKEITEIIRIKLELNRMYNEIDIPNKTRLNFYCFYDNGVDIELNNWFSGTLLGNIIVPVTKKQAELYKTKIEDIHSVGFIQNCNQRDGRRFSVDGNIKYD